MALIRYRPLSDELKKLHKEVHKLFDIPLEDQDDDVAYSDFIPKVNINEKIDSFEITTDLPGMNQKDISVNIENRILTICGERKFERDESKDNFHRIEKMYGKFCRSFKLPDTVKEEEIKAGYKNGVLSINLKKREAAAPKKIKIKNK